MLPEGFTSVRCQQKLKFYLNTRQLIKFYLNTRQLSKYFIKVYYKSIKPEGQKERPLPLTETVQTQWAHIRSGTRDAPLLLTGLRAK